MYKSMNRLGLSRYKLNRVFTAIESVAGKCRGKYSTFAAAEAAVPRKTKIGYNHPEAAELYTNSVDRVKPSDYAALYWLRPIVMQSSVVFDFGGNLGQAYYAFSQFLAFPDNLHWIVCDVPSVTEAGARLAKERHADQLLFANDIALGDGADIFYSSGALQYVEEPLSSSLARMHEKPPHILINRTAVWDGEPFVTLDNIGPVLCPYQVSNRQNFVRSIEELGYELMGAWQCYESSCHVRFHPTLSLDCYWGFYFRALGTPRPNRPSSSPSLLL